MRIFFLNKVVLSLTQNPGPFLNGLASNSMNAPRSALLNLHGRIVATFDQITIDEEELWMVIEKPFVGAVKEHLDKYLKLAGVKLKELNKNVYFDLDSQYKIREGDKVISQKTGQMVLTSRELPVNVTSDEFILFRLKNNIAVHGIDYQDEMLLNVSEDEFVSYTKGCFLGQEFVSKVHNRSKPTWKLVVRSEDECSEEEKAKMTSKVRDLQHNRTQGFVFVKND